jgi:hypothetical protein
MTLVSVENHERAWRTSRPGKVLLEAAMRFDARDEQSSRPNWLLLCGPHQVLLLAPRATKSAARDGNLIRRGAEGMENEPTSRTPCSACDSSLERVMTERVTSQGHQSPMLDRGWMRMKIISCVLIVTGTS